MLPDLGHTVSAQAIEWHDDGTVPGTLVLTEDETFRLAVELAGNS